MKEYLVNCLTKLFRAEGSNFALALTFPSEGNCADIHGMQIYNN